jgi:hypothetical protein
MGRMQVYGLVFLMLLLLGILVTHHMPGWIGWPLVIAVAAYLNWKAIRGMLK